MSNQSKPMAVVTPLDQRRTSQSGQLRQQQHHQKQQRHREWDSRLSHATRNETPESGDSHNVLEQSQKTAVLDANSSLISHEKDIVQPQIQLQQPQLGSVPTVRCKARVAPDPEDLPDPSRIFGFYNKEEKELSGGKNVPVTKVNDDSTHNDSKSLHTLWSSMEQKQKLPLPVTGEEQNDIHVLSEKENEDLFSQNLKAMLNISHSSAAGEQRTVENFFITAAAAAASASASPASSPHKVSSQDLDGFKTFLSTHNLGKPRFIYYDGPNASVHAKTSLPWGVLISSPGPAQTKLMAAEMTAKAALKHIQIHGVPEGYCSSKKIPFVPMQVRRKKAAAAAAAASSSSSSSSSAATETTETSVARSTDGQEKSANFKTSHETKQRNLVDFAPHTIQENDDYLSTRVETVHTSRQCIKGKAKKKPKIAANIGL